MLFSGKKETLYQSEEEKVREAIENADAVIIGAGAGLSTSAGFTYSGERFDNWENVIAMVKLQGYTIDETGDLHADGTVKMSVPTELIPKCPHCGKPMTMNLRADETFVEDEGWHQAAERYDNFLRTRRNQKIVFLELRIGYNTPVIIKYSFWRMTQSNPKAVYVCVNYGEAYAPDEIRKQSVCVDADIDAWLKKI